MYFPFYFTFISPTQGLGVVGPGDRSPLANEILIYGLFAFVFLSLLVATALRHPFFTRSGLPVSQAHNAQGGEPTADESGKLLPRYHGLRLPWWAPWAAFIVV